MLAAPASTQGRCFPEMMFHWSVQMYQWQRVDCHSGQERKHGGGYCTFAGQAVGGDSRKTLSAHVTESGSGMGAGVPVMHPWEMFHIKLGHLEMRREHRLAKQENRTTEAEHLEEIELPLKFQIHPTVQHRELQPVSWDSTWWKIAWEEKNIYICIYMYVCKYIGMYIYIYRSLRCIAEIDITL